MTHQSHEGEDRSEEKHGSHDYRPRHGRRAGGSLGVYAGRHRHHTGGYDIGLGNGYQGRHRHYDAHGVPDYSAAFVKWGYRQQIPVHDSACRCDRCTYRRADW